MRLASFRSRSWILVLVVVLVDVRVEVVLVLVVVLVDVRVDVLLEVLGGLIVDADVVALVVVLVDVVVDVASTPNSWLLTSMSQRSWACDFADLRAFGDDAAGKGKEKEAATVAGSTRQSGSTVA